MMPPSVFSLLWDALFVFTPCKYFALSFLFIRVREIHGKMFLLLLGYVPLLAITVSIYSKSTLVSN